MNTRVGYGASGRNSGFIIDTPHLTEHLSEEDNRRVSRLILAGLADLESHVQEHGIDCEWSPRGHLTAIVQPRREEKLHATARTLDAADEDYEWYDRNTIARVTGTGHYHAAVLTPRTVLVNPAALCRGLGETLPGNVELYMNWRFVEEHEQELFLTETITLLNWGAGHAAGMLGLDVSLDETGHVILASDAIFTMENLGPGSTRGIPRIGGQRCPHRRGNPRPRRTPECTGLVRTRHEPVHDPAEFNGRLV